MDWYNVEPYSAAIVDFSTNSLLAFSDVEGSGCARKDRSLGGVLKNTTMAWLTEHCTLRVVSLQKEETLSSYTFYRDIYNCASIVYVEQVISTSSPQNILLAVCLDSKHVRDHGDAGAVNSLIAIYSVMHSCVLSCFKLPLYVTCMHFMNTDNCRRSLFQSFDGCLAVGTQEGEILIIDLYLNKLLKIYEEQQTQLITSNIDITDCKIVNYDLPPDEIRRIYQKILRAQSVLHFGLRVDVVDSSCAVESLLPIDLITGLAAGLEDGRLVIYDLIELQIFYVSERYHNHMSLVKMDFLEPPDDPRACLYILTLHENGDEFIGELYDLMYEKRTTDGNGCYFENFVRGSRKLTLQLEKSPSSVISCQAISKLPKNADEDATSLFVISWHSILENQNKILVLDMNQWYKEEMPSQVNLRRAICYIAGYQLKGNQCGLEAFVNPATIANFNSLQRCEEHFYPNSLSFDCLFLFSTGCSLIKWPGIQNRVINNLRGKNATLFLEPEQIFEDIRRTRLMPQFTDLNVNAAFSKTAMNEVILSVALEHNCIGLIHDCVRSWSDGSFTGNQSWQLGGTELSVRFLANWIWKRASKIKTRCNELCQGLLCPTDGYSIDHRGKKELSAITSQLKHLTELMNAIVMQQHNNFEDEFVIAPKVESLHLAADYQELLLWLMNISLLPEKMQKIQDDDASTTTRMISAIYPYKRIRDFYAQKRATYAKANENCIKKSGSCRLLFIDAFIEHECMQRALADNTSVESCNTLREYWQENGGNGLYPPATIESMLRIILLPNITYESKCSVLWYFFLDLHVASNDTEQEDIKDLMANLLKFPSVFKLSTSLVKNVQGFWHLDHGNFLAAVDEFLSPFHKTQNYEQWLIELQVESLLIQNAPHLAVRILDAHPNLIAPTLKLNILLSNKLIAEAFHFARSKDDDDLMKRFFNSCLKMGNLGVIRDLALNEHEGQLVEQLLRRSQLPGAENLHFVYLLQKSKYIEAVSFMDELSTGKCLRSSNSGICNALDAPDLVNSAMNTMAPETQRLTDVYFRIRNKIKQRETNNRSPVPLSCQLIKQNANNLLGGLYHSSALSAHFASTYFDEQLIHGQQSVSNPLSAQNAPFLRKPQVETFSEAVNQLERQTICYPKEYERIKRKREKESEPPQEYKHQPQLQQISKKRRLGVEEIFSDLKRIKEQNVTLSEVGFNIETKKTINETKEMSESFMTKPVTETLSKHSNLSETNEIASLKPTTSSELHGILKSATPELSETRKQRRGESPAVEEKLLRFKLPPPNVKHPLNESENVENENFSATHKVLTGTISEGSCASEDVENVETTQYYSILPIDEKSESTDLPTIKDSGISLTSKPSEVQSSSTLLYQTARGRSHSPSIFGPQPRRPLMRSSAEPETHLRQTIFNAHLEEAANNVGKVKKITDLKMTSVVTLNSAEFTPKICSSKVGDTQSKFMAQAKLSERSTVIINSIDSLSSLEPHNNSLKVSSRLPLETIKDNINVDKMVEPLLDTTLGMSSCDVTPIEITKEEDKSMKEATNECIEKTAAENVEIFITARNKLEVSQVPSESEFENSQEQTESETRDSHVSTKSEFGDSKEPTTSENEDSNEAATFSETEFSRATNESTTLDSMDSIDSNDLELDTEETEEDNEPKKEVIIELFSSDEDDIIGNVDDFDNNDDYIILNDEIDAEEVDEVDEEDESYPYENIEAELEVENAAQDSYATQIESELNNEEEPASLKGDTKISDTEPNVLNTNDFSMQTQEKDHGEGFNLIMDDNGDGSNEMPTTSKAVTENIRSSHLIEAETKQAQNQRITESNEKKYNEKPSFKTATIMLEEVKTDDDKRKSELVTECDTTEQATEKPEYTPALAVENSAAEPTARTTSTETTETILENVLEVPDDDAKESSFKSAEEIEETKTENVQRLESPMPDNSIAIKNISEVENSAAEPTARTTSTETTETILENVLEVPDDDAKESSFKSAEEIEETKTENGQRLESPVPDNSIAIKNISEVDAMFTETLEKPEEKLSGDSAQDNKESAISLSHSLNEKAKDDTSATSSTKPSETLTSDVEKHTEQKDEHREHKNTESADEKPEKPSTAALESPQPYKLAHNLRSSQAVENDFKKDNPADVSISKTTPRNRKRGQSMPPQPILSVHEDHMETDNRTPKRRSTRGISVPPQAIDNSNFNKLVETTPMTPTSRHRYSTRRTTIAESGDSPQSTNSSHSGRSSQLKRLQIEHGSTPILDSPALRTRARLRTMSESSDVTQVSTPTTSVKKRRRTSISNQSDTEGTPRARRILLKDDEEEEEEAGPSTSSMAYAETRRVTRRQRTLLETLHTKPATEDDQVSTVSQISQSSLQRKMRSTRSGSVKSHDDIDDDAVSVTSSAASELRRSSRRLRSQQQQQHNSNPNLTVIPEQEDGEEGQQIRTKRTRAAKK